MSFEVTVTQKDQTLPMILNLRGDEIIVDEFTFDSDQAMNYLGIKRSRLNQISGRELRVARVRRDRYIRPVYREVDLKDYLDWTRATATHLSSSKAIEQAVENLDDRFNDVLQVFNSKLEQVAGEQQVWMRGEFERLPTKIQSPSTPANEAIESAPLPLMNSDKVLRRVSGQLDDVKAEVSTLEQKIQEVMARVDSIIPETKELNVAQKSLRLDFDQRFEALLKRLWEVQGNLGSALYEQGVKVENLLVKMEAKERLDEEEATPIIPPKSFNTRTKMHRPSPNLRLRRYNAD